MPDTLNAIGVGAVERQEVKDDTAGESRKYLTGLALGVDAAIVEVDAMGSAVPAREQPEQLAEQGDVFARGPRRVQALGTHIECAGQVELSFLPGVTIRR